MPGQANAVTPGRHWCDDGNCVTRTTNQAANSVYCAHCGTKNPDNIDACERCGELLIRPDPAHPHELGIKSCPDCNTVNESHARFCIGCGRDIDAIMATSAAPRAARPTHPPPPTAAPVGQPTPKRPPRPASPDPGNPGNPSEVRRPTPGPGRPSVVTSGAGAEDLRNGAEAAAHAPSDSGTPEAQLPEELKGWNWGAFLLPFIWGPFNRVWIGLGGLVVFAIPPIPWELGVLGYVALALVMGSRGNEWAWRARKWESLDHFRKVQRVWMTWGTVGFMVLGVITAMALAASGGGGS